MQSEEDAQSTMDVAFLPVDRAELYQWPQWPTHPGSGAVRVWRYMAAKKWSGHEVLWRRRR